MLAALLVAAVALAFRHDALRFAASVRGQGPANADLLSPVKRGLLRCMSPVMACAVQRRRFPVGARPTRRPLQPEATGAVMEVTKWLKPSDSVSRYTVTARVCRP